MVENYKVRGEEWWHDALCADTDTDPDAFFGRSTQLAKEICKKCDVQDECRSDRLERDVNYSKIDIYGFQGGITSTEAVRRLGKLAR